jgi:hypothetical protein
MSSETSTKQVRQKPDATDAGLQPWQFFVLAALGCATAVTFLTRGQGPTAVILLGILMAAAALVGYAALRMIRPLVSPDEDRTVMIGHRTRVALEREKLLSLRSIKELEFDRAMGRLSDEDWREMSGRLRTRAARLIRQLDAGSGYREQIERELSKRLGDANARRRPSRHEDDARLKPLRSEEGAGDARGTNALDDTHIANDLIETHDGFADTPGAPASAERVCASCETQNDPDARFCKGCGAKLS